MHNKIYRRFKMNKTVKSYTKAYTKELKNFQKEAIKQTREVADASVDAVLNGKKVVRKAEKATLKLNSIAYGTVEKLIGKRFDVMEKNLEATAKRIKATMKAKDLKTLVKAHADLNEKTIARLTKDVNDTINIVVDTKDNVVELFNNVYNTKPAKKVAKKISKKATKTAAKAKKTVKAKAKPAKKAVTKTAKKVSKKVTKKATRKPVKKTAKRTAKKVAKKTTRRRRAA